MEVFGGVTKNTGKKISANQTSSGAQVTGVSVDKIMLKITLTNTCSQSKVINTRETKTGTNTIVTSRISDYAAQAGSSVVVKSRSAFAIFQYRIQNIIASHLAGITLDNASDRISNAVRTTSFGGKSIWACRHWITGAER